MENVKLTGKLIRRYLFCGARTLQASEIHIMAKLSIDIWW